MLIPIKCFSCGLPIAHKYEKYLAEKTNKEKDFNRNDEHIFKKLRLRRYCCRRMLLTNVNLIKNLK
jgi:DNA-directed RNA polymerase I, II, and III subunit RPABC5